VFVKAKKTKADTAAAHFLNQGPEGAWIKDWDIVRAVMRRMVRQLSTVIYPGQDESDRLRLLRPVQDVRAMMDEMDTQIGQVDRR
jgi:hypothetical protein